MRFHVETGIEMEGCDAIYYVRWNRENDVFQQCSQFHDAVAFRVLDAIDEVVNARTLIPVAL